MHRGARWDTVHGLAESDMTEWLTMLGTSVKIKGLDIQKALELYMLHGKKAVSNSCSHLVENITTLILCLVLVLSLKRKY